MRNVQSGVVEIHPFGIFVPQSTEYLFLGSFTGKIEDDAYDWFYANKRNQFWSIMEKVYEINIGNSAFSFTALCDDK